MNEFAIRVQTGPGREYLGAAAFISFSLYVYIFVNCSLGGDHRTYAFRLIL